MANAEAMLQTHPTPTDGDAHRLAGVIGRLLECATTCTQCADACLGERDVAELRRCIELNLDCADVCATTSRVIARITERPTEVVRPLLEACLAACRACAEECESHADHMEHCRICAQECRRCAEACHELLASMA